MCGTGVRESGLKIVDKERIYRVSQEECGILRESVP